MVNVSFNGPGSKQGYADPPPPLRNDQIFMKDARNVLKQMKNQFCDIYFSSYGWFCSQFSNVFALEFCFVQLLVFEI